MNSISKSNGLSARRTTIHQVKKSISNAARLGKRGTAWGVAVGIFITMASCHEKTNGQNSADRKKNPTSIVQDSLNKPKVNIKVNRRFDDKGNMIGFDSTYSSFYSNMKGDTIKMDSMMHSFDSYFNRNHSSFFNKQFDPLFFNDSLRYPDFFNRDFFLKRYELNDEYLRGMMNRMDSIKNRFYQEHNKNKTDSKDL